MKMRSLVTILSISLFGLVIATSVWTVSTSQTLIVDGSSETLIIDGIVVNYPSDWTATRYPTISTLTKRPAGASALPTDPALLAELAHMTVSTETRRNHAEAVRRLRELSGWGNVALDVLQIGGWPAIQLQFVTARTQPSQGDALGSETVLVVRTAVAVGSTLLRLEAWLPPDASEELIAEVRAIGTGLVFDTSGDPAEVELEIKLLQESVQMPAQEPDLSPESGQTATVAATVEADSGTASPGSVPLSSVVSATAATSGASVPVSFDNFPDSELEIAVSADGRDIVIGSNGLWYFSNDAGQSWAATTVNGNDPSVAWGQSGGPQGTFYAANISIPTAGSGSTIIQVSTDGGATWSSPTPAYTCAQNGDLDCITSVGGVSFPDQEHIAVDRLNVTAGGNQVYSAWRHRLSGGWSIVCSADSATTWSANRYVSGPGDIPRITVGADGFVYVVYLDSGNIMLDKFRSCETQSNPMTNEPGFPQSVRLNVVDVACPMPGLNRCNNGNRLLSPVVAVDDTDSSHIYVSYANNTNPGDGTPCTNQNLCDEDVTVQDSLDGGLTWPGDPTDICVASIICLKSGGACAVNSDCFDPDRTVTISSGVTARRFMPWVCSVGGNAYVSWYDRRAASPGGTTESNNSLTDFYAASAFLDPLGALAAGPEFQVNDPGTADPQCEAGFATGSPNSWPVGTRATGDSDSCSVQPQLAGFCCSNADLSGGGRCQFTMGAGSSLNRCDFSDTPGTATPPCLANEVCAIASGFPKYGDYNGNACGVGRLYTTWASSIGPLALPAATDIDSFFSSKIVCCVPQIQVPGAVDFGAACGTATQTATLDVCNSGKEDLEVASITSDDPQFGVTTPLSGFPVTISPDFCFPFQATFTPDGSGEASATLTIANNDPVSPSLAVSVSGSVGVAEISTFIADSGSFGDVCADDLLDLNLTVQNNGLCPLEIDSVTIVEGSNTQAGDFVEPAGGFAGTIIEPANSLLIPIRFSPSDFDNASPATRLATVRIESSTQFGSSLATDDTPIDGVVPPPDINVAIANSGDFDKVCKTDQADLDLTLLNQGKCDLTISDISLVADAGSFELPADLIFPLVLSPDADFPFPVRFAPTVCFDTPENRTVRITSDDPDENPVDVGISGTSPCPNLVIDPAALTALNAFPATVVDDTGTLGCFTDRSVTLRNNGLCPLTIYSIAAAGVSGDAADYAVTAPTLFPVILPTGEETLGVTVRFTPQTDANPLAPSEVTGLLTVVSDDPASPDTADVCGESVAQSGLRALVTDVTSGAPVIVGEVDSITLQSKGKNRPGPINLQFTDLAPSNDTICENPTDWHINLENLPSTATTGSGPKSSYQLKAREGNLQTARSFGLGQCEFLEFQLELQSSDPDDGMCLLAPKGDSCTLASECCSGKCKGPAGGKTCK